MSSKLCAAHALFFGYTNRPIDPEFIEWATVTGRASETCLVGNAWPDCSDDAKDLAAAALGRRGGLKGGLSTSEAKRAAGRENAANARLAKKIKAKIAEAKEGKG